MTLPGEFAPDGSVSAGQDWFDFTIQDAGGFSASLADAVFVLMRSGESGLRRRAEYNPFDDACYSISRYDLDVPATSLSVSPASIPALLRFGYAEMAIPRWKGRSASSTWRRARPRSMRDHGYGDPLAVHMYLLSPPQLTLCNPLRGGCRFR